MAASSQWKDALRVVGFGLGGYAAYRAVASQLRRFDFCDRAVVITGGSRGLGLVIARRLAEEGAKLAICARNEQELNRAAQEVRGRGALVFSYVCDITHE